MSHPPRNGRGPALPTNREAGPQPPLATLLSAGCLSNDGGPLLAGPGSRAKQQVKAGEKGLLRKTLEPRLVALLIFSYSSAVCIPSVLAVPAMNHAEPASVGTHSCMQASSTLNRNDCLEAAGTACRATAQQQTP